MQVSMRLLVSQRVLKLDMTSTRGRVSFKSQRSLVKIFVCAGNTSQALHNLKVAHPYPNAMETQRKPRKAAATYLAMKH